MSAKGSVPAGKTRALSSSAVVAPIARMSNGHHTVADLRAPSQLDVGRTCNSSRDTFRLIIIASAAMKGLARAPEMSARLIETARSPLLPRFVFEPPYGNRG